MSNNIKSTVPAGMLSIWGRKPGSPSPYTGPFSIDFQMLMYSYETTKEGIRQMLPEPFELADQLPVVSAFVAQANHMRSYDGRRHRYVEMAWWLPCQYKGLKGIFCPVMYINSPSGDPSDGAFLGAADREVHGFPKKVSPVKLTGDGYNYRAITHYRGVKLIDIKFKLEKEVSAPPSFVNEYYQTYLFLKEIPNCDFTGYDVRKVIALVGTPTIHKMMVGKASMELGHLDSEPCDVLEVIKPGPAYEMQLDFGDFKTWEVDDLLK